MTYFFIIALTLSLIMLMRQYIISNRNYDYAIIFPTILSWINVYFQNNTLLYVIFFLIPIIAILSNLLWDEQTNLFTFSKNDDNKEYQENKLKVEESIKNYNNILSGVQGIISNKMKNDSYLGKITKDGKIQDIIIYSNDIMNEGDKFEIIGIQNGKFMAFKINE